MEKVRLFKEDKVVASYSIAGAESGVVFATGLFKAKAEKIVECWNNHDTLTAKAELFDDALDWVETAKTLIGRYGNVKLPATKKSLEMIETLLSAATELKNAEV